MTLKAVKARIDLTEEWYEVVYENPRTHEKLVFDAEREVYLTIKPEQEVQRYEE